MENFLKRVRQPLIVYRVVSRKCLSKSLFRLKVSSYFRHLMLCLVENVCNPIIKMGRIDTQDTERLVYGMVSNMLHIFSIGSP